MQFDRLKRRGVLSPDLCEVRLRTFRRGLKETDYVEGQNVKIEYRYRFMLLSLDLLRSLVRYCCGISFFAALAICSGIGGQVLAQASYDNSETPEGWAWARIKEGKAANFNERCGTPALDSRAGDETGWTNSCRRISATFLVDILTRAPWRNQVSFAGVNIIGTRIEGDIDFQNAKLDRSLMVEQSQIENSSMGSPSFKGVSLFSAKVTGGVEMAGATFGGDLGANSMQVGADLFMGSTDESKTSFKGVSLSGANVAGNVFMHGATFDGDLDATALQVGGDLTMGSNDQSKASFKGVSLISAKVAGNVFMNGAIGTKRINMVFARIGVSLDIRGTTLAELDLSGASIAGDLRLSGFKSVFTPTRWRTAEGKPGHLILRNTRIANLMDAQDAWPTKGYLHLDGFTFARLGGFAGQTGPEMRARGIDWWDDWARRDGL